MAGGDDGRLDETTAFGRDPGSLRMLTYHPVDLPAGAPLLVALHGCTQSAAAYDHDAGWTTLADRFGFAVLLPEQRRANNPNLCFNWFEPGDTERGAGEVGSIRAMVDHALGALALDRRRVFVAGLSAGGAMAAALLATYPEVFAAGAIVAGLPYGTAQTTTEAFERMRTPDPRPAPALGDLVRAASPHRGPWPRVAVWHGTADRTVHPGNAARSVAQWLDVHRLGGTPARSGSVDGFPYLAWVDASGVPVVEQHRITGMGHGTPVARAGREAEQCCGETGPHAFDVGISSAFRICRSFGIAAGPARLGRGAGSRPRPAPPPARRDPGRIVREALRSAGLLRDG